MITAQVCTYGVLYCNSSRSNLRRASAGWHESIKDVEGSLGCQRPAHLSSNLRGCPAHRRQAIAPGVLLSPSNRHRREPTSSPALLLVLAATAYRQVRARSCTCWVPGRGLPSPEETLPRTAIRDPQGNPPSQNAGLYRACTATSNQMLCRSARARRAPKQRLLPFVQRYPNPS